MAATLALKTGDRDSIRAQLPPDLHAPFDLAYSVQELRDGSEGSNRLSLRTQDEVEKRQAARAAAEAVARQEHEALLAATDADADAFGDVMSSMQLDDIPDPEFLIEGFLYKRSVARLYGPPKSYKSFVMLDMAGCVGAGIEWLGKKTTPAKVLYIVAEGVQGLKRRVRAWEAHNKRTMTGVDFYPKAVQLGKREEVRSLIAFAKKRGYGLIILDTQARCTVGVEENSNTDMGVVVAALDVLKEITGACIALVHHSGANESKARGATAVLGALDAEFRVEADKATSSVKLETMAQKDTGEHPIIEMDLVTPGPGMALAVKPRPKWYRQTAADLAPLPGSELTVLAVLNSFGGAGGTVTNVHRKMDREQWSVEDVRTALGQMHRKGVVRSKGATFYLERTGYLHLEGTLDHADQD
jgi:hypothetical protein